MFEIKQDKAHVPHTFSPHAHKYMGLQRKHLKTTMPIQCDIISENNLFAESRNPLGIGSIYFRSADMWGKTMEQRIRLVHHDGPDISKEHQEVKWYYTTEKFDPSKLKEQSLRKLLEEGYIRASRR